MAMKLSLPAFRTQPSYFATADDQGEGIGS